MRHRIPRIIHAAETNKQRSRYLHSFVHISSSGTAASREENSKKRRQWFIIGKSSKSGESDTRLQMWQFKYMKLQRIRSTTLNVLLKYTTESSATKVEPFNLKAILKSKWTHLSLKVNETWQVLYRWEELSPGTGCKVLVHRERNYRREKKNPYSISDWGEKRCVCPWKSEGKSEESSVWEFLSPDQRVSKQHSLFM